MSLKLDRKMQREVEYLRARIPEIEKRKEVKAREVNQMEEHLSVLIRDLIRSSKVIDELRKVESE